MLVNVMIFANEKGTTYNLKCWLDVGDMPGIGITFSKM